MWFHLLLSAHAFLVWYPQPGLPERRWKGQAGPNAGCNQQHLACYQFYSKMCSFNGVKGKGQSSGVCRESTVGSKPLFSCWFKAFFSVAEASMLVIFLKNNPDEWRLNVIYAVKVKKGWKRAATRAHPGSRPHLSGWFLHLFALWGVKITTCCYLMCYQTPRVQFVFVKWDVPGFFLWGILSVQRDSDTLKTLKSHLMLNKAQATTCPPSKTFFLFFFFF